MISRTFLSLSHHVLRTLRLAKSVLVTILGRLAIIKPQYICSPAFTRSTFGTNVFRSITSAGQNEATFGLSFVDWRRGDGIAPCSVCPRPCHA
ncbi:hypothetical protein PtB15_12B310 [Puccinia triticina]|nr:hypothetical protein PtB15_12B310 [Puccinia triticina]